jgi:hypothetical protein
VLVVADLTGDVAQAGPREAGGAFGDDDVRPADGAQVEALVQGAEDAGGQVIARQLAERSGGSGVGHQQRGLLPGGAGAALLGG